MTRHTRCALVTGVQTWALPIFTCMSVTPSAISAGVSDVAPPLVTTCRYNEVLPRPLLFRNHFTANGLTTCVGELLGSFRQLGLFGVSGRKQSPGALLPPTERSEESRVGKECIRQVRSRGA